MPENPINDATAYGVQIQEASLAQGETYWRVIRVHHLTPEENHGNHHIYLDALDEAGNRIAGAQARVTWEGGQQTVTIDKPAGEPGANFPMWKWQICAVTMLGLPSDQVTNLHTGHPDEPPGMGNTLFHHSFQVDFQRSVKGAAPAPEQSVISGAVTNGAGRTLLLLRNGEVIADLRLGQEGAFSFSNLAAGSYVLSIEGTDVQSATIELDGQNSVTVNLTVPEAPPSGKLLAKYVLFGLPASPRTAVFLALAQGYLLREQPAFGFSEAEAVQAGQVIILGELQDISQATEDALIAAGCTARRIQGTPEEILAALEADEGGDHNVFFPTLPM